MIVNLDKIKELVRVNQLFGSPSSNEVKDAVELIETIASKTGLYEPELKKLASSTCKRKVSVQKGRFVNHGPGKNTFFCSNSGMSI